MSKDELLNKYSEIIDAINEKEAKLEGYVNKWLNGESTLSSNSVESLIDTVNQQLEQMRKEAETYLNEFYKISEEEHLKEQQLFSSKIALKSKLDIDVDTMVITGGVLSSNASESHLIGREKTAEEIELDKQIALATLREKVAKKEIPLAEASKLKNNIEMAYVIPNEMSSQRHI